MSDETRAVHESPIRQSGEAAARGAHPAKPTGVAHSSFRRVSTLSILPFACIFPVIYRRRVAVSWASGSPAQPVAQGGGDRSGLLERRQMPALLDNDELGAAN